MKAFTCKSFLILSLFFSFNPNSFSQDEKPFVSGEKLVYVAHMGWLNAGTAEFTLHDSVFEGSDIYYANAQANTIGLANKLYKVRDVYESYFDRKNGLPKLAIRNINEGSYTYYNEVRYNHLENKVESQKSGEHEVSENILDMVSAFYYFRESLVKQIRNIGDEIVVDTYFSDEIFPLKLRYVGIDKIKTKMGKFKCLKFSPVVEPGRIFDSEDDVTIWISNDKNYIPLQIRIDLMIGSIKCDLVEYSGLQHPINKIK
ncbi:MAG: DUF3108 domain-containing protein [Bacteroidales bacterium]|nr:DUF3108 domain-containing protein [Bacteroidales bacterium]